jgi:DNA-binding GntR family transcriptional regulator
VSVTLENTSLTDSLCDALRQQIISGQIEPGRKLSEVWVAGYFEVARPTAKAGLDRLTNEGLLRRGRRQTAVVPQLAAADIDDLYFAREPIETRAVRTLAERAAVPREAERALALMGVAAQLDQHADHAGADVALHRALVAATGSTRLQRMHESVMGESQLCIVQVRNHVGLDLAELTATHAAILDAIRAGDPDAAERALHNDLNGCRETLLSDIARREASLSGAAS